MGAERPRTGSSAASWRRDIPACASSTSRSGSRTGTSTPRRASSASIDLALAWVEEDCGAALAHEAARELVLFLRRPGGQPQLSVSLASQASEMTSIRELQIWIAEHLATQAVGRGPRGSDVDERAKLRARIYSRGRHDAVPVRASDARGGGAASARAHGWRPASRWPRLPDSAAST